MYDILPLLAILLAAFGGNILFTGDSHIRNHRHKDALICIATSALLFTASVVAIMSFSENYAESEVQAHLDENKDVSQDLVCGYSCEAIYESCILVESATSAD